MVKGKINGSYPTNTKPKNHSTDLSMKIKLHLRYA